MDQLVTMARGLLAAEEIDKHADRICIPAPAGDDCLDCRRAAAAVLRGQSRAEVAGLFCAPMRQWIAEVAAAREIAREVLG